MICNHIIEKYYLHYIKFLKVMKNIRTWYSEWLQIRTCLISNEKIISTVMISNLEKRRVPRLHFILFKYHWKTCKKTAESVSKQNCWFLLYFPQYFCPQFAKETLYTKMALMHHLHDLGPSLASVPTISILSILL